MRLTLHPLSVYEEIVAHTNLKLMTKLTDKVTDYDSLPSSKEQSEAFRRAWIANTEVKLLERKKNFHDHSNKLVLGFKRD